MVNASGAAGQHLGDQVGIFNRRFGQRDLGQGGSSHTPDVRRFAPRFHCKDRNFAARGPYLWRNGHTRSEKEHRLMNIPQKNHPEVPDRRHPRIIVPAPDRSPSFPGWGPRI